MTLEEFVRVHWTRRMEEVRLDINGADLTEEEKQGIRSAGVILKTDAPHVTQEPLPRAYTCGEPFDELSYNMRRIDRYLSGNFSDDE